AYGRKVKREVLSSAGSLVACEEKAYDPCGNLILEKTPLFLNGEYQKTLQIKYCYTSLHQVESFTRAYDSLQARTTRYVYTAYRLPTVKIKPDGVSLNYDYHPFGYLKSLSSSDGRLDLHYDYNLLGELVNAEDRLQNIFIKREVDAFGHVL